MRILLCYFVLLSFYSCASGRIPVTPGTIPKQEATITPEDQKYGSQVLRELSKQYPTSNDSKYIDRVDNIVIRLTDAIKADTNPWQTYVLKGDDIVNAAATRGNYIFVWTGMLQKARNDAELASVIAHEIGHVLANHTMPTPGEQANTAMGGIAGSITQEIIVAKGGGVLGQLGGQIVQDLLSAIISNPQSQRLELEADHIGLFIMARAKYDPRKALDFWMKLKDDPNFNSNNTLEFLSTHPATDTRILELNKLLPKAMEIYNSKKNLAS
jgi:predicted Zn-dependent protease